MIAAIAKYNSVSQCKMIILLTGTDNSRGCRAMTEPVSSTDPTGAATRWRNPGLEIIYEGW